MRTLLPSCLFLLLLCAGPVQAQAVDHRTQSITLGLSSEPPTLNSLESTDQVSSFILAHVQEGLLRYGPDGELAPGVAERWQVDESRARFWLRRNARWQDGRPVTAHDFVFAWRQVLRPETASQYAFILYPIRHAEAVNRGELPPEALGVRALDDHTLEVDLAQPTPYFAGLTAFMTYYPLRADFFQRHGERYAANADSLLGNGPFRLTRWVHGASLRLEKNPHYWAADDVRIERIDIAHITSDPQAMFRLYRNGSIAMTGLAREFLDEALALGYPVRHFANGTLFYLQFNHRPERPTAHRKLRQAIQALFDPAVLANRIIALPGVMPAHSLFPAWVPGLEGRLIEEFPPPRSTPSLQRARALLQEYLDETGQRRPPALSVLTGESPIGVQQAEYLQYLLRSGLGIELRIDRQIFKQALEKMRIGDFDLVFSGWGPDFNDAMTFADLFASWNENNRGRYRSADYDAQVRTAQSTVDTATRVAAFVRIQQIVHDDVVILPMYENSSVYVQHPQLHGVVRSIFGGDPNFRHAWIEAPAQGAAP